jgi:nicotinate-nucleotide adenylyltransferase
LTRAQRDAARWGILGGTFDPIHFAHLAIAEEARESLTLDLVVFIPAAIPVHKPRATVSSAEDRARMVELGIADNACFRLSRIELEREGPSYSVVTVEQLARENPGVDLVFLMSAEAAHSLSTWRAPRRLLELCQVAVVPRLGYALPSRAWLAGEFPGQADRFIFVDTPALGHSASDIRARVRAGRSIRYLVPPAVQEYIVQHGLYRDR